MIWVHCGSKALPVHGSKASPFVRWRGLTRSERQNEAVELVVESSDARFAVEHTRIESFPDQIADGQAFPQLIEPLETSLRGALSPGRYRLTVDVGAASRVRRKDFDVVRGAIEGWAVEKAPTLNPDPNEGQNPRDTTAKVTKTPANVPFEITVQRTPSVQVSVFVSRFSPPDVEKARRTRVETALQKKCGKLGTAKQAFAATSILVLESDDIALANRNEVSRTVVDAIKARDHVPDMILLVETDRGLEWLLWVVKDGDAIYPALERSGPFPRNHHTDEASR